LDLELPGLDGFVFLRLLAARAPTPVVVVSGYAHQADVFKALELGAFDFVAKPGAGGDLERFGAEVREKLLATRELGKRSGSPGAPRSAGPERLLVVGASSGGPPAIQRLLEDVGTLPGLSVLV